MDDGLVRRDERILETMLARLALAAALPLPPRMLQPALDLMVGILKRRHPGAFERLADLPESQVLVDPVDLPLAFVMQLGGAGVRLALARRGSIAAAATIRGSFADLLDLLEGRTDGDALFFSRDLTIEGDTGAVVALRNAVDGEEIDLAADLAAFLGPFGRLLSPARQAAVRVHQAVAELQDAVLAPASRRIETVERRLSRLENKKA